LVYLSWRILKKLILLLKSVKKAKEKWRFDEFINFIRYTQGDHNGHLQDKDQ
jgi:hypothetical protein